MEAIDKPAALWRVPRSGGAPAKVVEGVLQATYAVRAGGVYFVDQVSGQAGTHYVDQPAGVTRLRYLDFATRRTTTVAMNLGQVDLPIAVSPDGRTILFPRLDGTTNDLMLVSSFR